MNEIECLMVAMLLFRKVLERVKERGHLTAAERSQILKTIQLLTNQFLSGGILHELGQSGQLLGQFQVPRVQNGNLEQKGADADYE